jgi:hypothetical protein
MDNTFYASSNYQRHQQYQEIYAFISSIILQELRPESVIDWGCGSAYLLHDLMSHGIEVQGVEGSEESVKFHLSPKITNKIAIQDLLTYRNYKTYNLAVCMEVGEHLEFVQAESLVQKVAQSGKTIWWTAAQIGQNGPGHINCRPLYYWEKLFNENDCYVNWLLTYKIKSLMLKSQKICLGYPWFRDNLMIFRKGYNQ